MLSYKLEAHWRSHAIIRTKRSREILSAHFRNSKIHNGSKFLFKMPVIIIIKSWPGVMSLVYYYRIYLNSHLLNVFEKNSRMTSF